MYSKKLKRSFFVLALVLSTVLIFNTGCSQLFGEKAPKVVTPDASGGFEIQCLSNVLPVMKKFMNGEATTTEVGGAWTCFSNGVQAFQKKMRGSSLTEYKRRDVAKFFEDFVLKKGTVIGDPLLKEIMHLKQVFIGGSEEAFTRDELSKLINFSNEMKRITLNLHPYMKIYSLNWQIKEKDKLEESSQFFELSNLAIQQAAKDIAVLVTNGNGYTLDNFALLMHQMADLYGEKWDWIKKVEDVMPLIKKLKGTLAGGDPGVIARDEWRRFALLSFRGYVQYLRYHYFIDNAELIAGSEIAFVSSSVTDLFSYLGDMVREKPGGEFKKEELKQIVEAINKLFPDVNITSALIDEAMKLKSLLFGGSLEKWTPDDFDKAKVKVQVFRSVAERVLNYAQFYSFKWKPSELSEAEAYRYFQSGERNLLESAETLGGAMETPYDLVDLEKFCNEVEKIFPNSENPMQWPGEVKRYLPTVIAYKRIVLSDEDSLIRKNKWIDILQLSSRIYGRFLYFSYFIKDTSILSGSGLVSFESFGRKSLDLLKEVIHRKQADPTDPSQPDDQPRQPLDGVISFAEMDTLVDAMEKSKLLYKNLTAKTVKQTLRPLIFNILLNPQVRLAGVKPKGLGYEVVDVLFNELNNWTSNERYLENFYLRLGSGLSTSQIIKELQLAQQTEGTKELIHIFDSPLPLSFDQNDFLHLSNQFIGYNFYSVSMMNVSRVLARTIIRSYTMDLGRINSYTGISGDEVQTLYDDLKPLLNELELLHADQVGFARSRFLEANMFTPFADGNQFAGLRETSHLVMMIMSGLRISDLAEKKIIDKCAMRVDPAYYKSRVDVSCVAQIYYLDILSNQKTSFISGMPEVIDFTKAHSVDVFNTYFVDLLIATGWDQKPNDKKATLGELSLVPHIFQYLESVLHRFDADKNGSLNDDEALAAYPTYAELVKKVSGIENNTINRAAFLFIVNHGRIPKGFDDLILLLKELIKKEFFNEPIGINSDRPMLAKMFGAIAANSRSITAPGKKPDFTPTAEFKNILSLPEFK